jgi:hypothetical protein
MAAGDTTRAAETRARRADRFKWIEDVLASELDPALKVLAVRIGLHRNDRTGQCNPSAAALTQGTGNNGKWARRTVQRQLKALRARAWIAYAENRGGRRRSTQYTLTKPRHPDVALSSPVNRDTQRTKLRHTEFKTATPRSRTNLRTIENLSAGARAERDENSRTRPPTHGKFSNSPSTVDPHVTAEQPPKEQMKQNFDGLFAEMKAKAGKP